MNKTSRAVNHSLSTAAVLALAACSLNTPKTLVTIADARVDAAQFLDLGRPGDSEGDIVIFDQPLLNETMAKIGNNSGTCIRTRAGHSFQCQWTLTLEDGSIQVAGREFDQGTSTVSIVGGTGRYSRIRGEMESVNNDNGTFTQTLRYWTR
jgi:ABC-type amino acid transport substrate-binding protein